MAARRLTAKERRELPARAFGIPSSRKYPVMVLNRSGEPVPSKGHAVDAKGRAKEELEKGRIDRRQYNQIIRKADSAIKEVDRARKKAKRKPAKKKKVAKRKVAKKKAGRRRKNPQLTPKQKSYLFRLGKAGVLKTATLTKRFGRPTVKWSVDNGFAIEEETMVSISPEGLDALNEFAPMSTLEEEEWESVVDQAQIAADRRLRATPWMNPKKKAGRRRKKNPADLEGPFTFRSGRVVYYDPGEGKYYDRSTDLYLSESEVESMQRGSKSTRTQPSRGMRKNPIDHNETDLELTIVNDGVLYERLRAPLEAQLAKKKAQGKYSHSAAVKGWRRFVDEGARKYAKDAGFSSRERFPSAMRDSVAERLATEWEEQYEIEANPKRKTTRRRRNPSEADHERVGMEALKNSHEYWDGYIADKSKTNLLVDAYKFLVIAHEELKYAGDAEPRLEADHMLKAAHKELSKKLK